MANSGFLLRSLVSNPTKITTKFVVKPSQILVTRPFSSIVSNPISPNPNSNPPIISPDSVTQITRIDPFNKEAVNEKKVVEEFFKARTDGLFITGASKMFDRMSKRKRQQPFHQAIDRCRSRNRTPDVIAHIAVLEAYANAGLTHHGAHRVYLKMLGPGIIPNQHTYDMLIQLLAGASTSSNGGGGDWMMIKQAQKYIFEMLDKGMMPDAPTSVAIFKALAKEGKLREGEEFLEDLKARGWVVDDMVFREVVKGKGGDPIRVLKGKGGHLIKSVFEILFDKKL